MCFRGVAENRMLTVPAYRILLSKEIENPDLKELGNILTSLSKSRAR